MSNFKIGDRIECVKTEGIRYLTVGKVYTVIDMEYNNPIVLDNTGTKNGYYPWRFKLLVEKQKPAKKYTETDRRKAAKEVIAAQDKLKVLVDKAKETGIQVEFVNQSIGMIDVQMSYQPETPKKRIYK